MSLPEASRRSTGCSAEARRDLDRVEPVDLGGRDGRAGRSWSTSGPSSSAPATASCPARWSIDRNVLEWRLDPSSPHRMPEADAERRVIVVCNEGYQSSLAAATLRRLGVRRATDLVGGFQALLGWA